MNDRIGCGAPQPGRDLQRFEQCITELFEFAACPDLHLTGAASRDLLEVSEFDLERDCSAADTGPLAVFHTLSTISRSASRAAS